MGIWEPWVKRDNKMKLGWTVLILSVIVIITFATLPALSLLLIGEVIWTSWRVAFVSLGVALTFGCVPALWACNRMERC